MLWEIVWVGINIRLVCAPCFVSRKARVCIELGQQWMIEEMDWMEYRGIGRLSFIQWEVFPPPSQ